MSIDILPTLLHVLGEESELSKGDFDGISLVEIFKQPNSKKERDLFWHFPHYRGKDVVPYSIVRSDRFKLIKYYDGKESELYDVISDISEINNIRNENPSKVYELEMKINEWVKMTNSPIPILKE
jgi:arylsulfatase A-like enzyme